MNKKKTIAGALLTSTLATALAAYLAASRAACRDEKQKKALGALRHRLFAHRGLFDNEGDAPENTLAAFSLAVEKGVGIELDVHLTADGKIAVAHDDSLLRICKKDLRISESAYADIRGERIFSSDEGIPLLSEVLSLVNGRVPLLIEIKVDNNNYEPLCDALAAELCGYDGEILLQSFDPRALSYLAKICKRYPIGQLAANFKGKAPGRGRAVSIASRTLLLNALSRPDFVSYEEKSVDPLAALSMKFWRPVRFVWTVKEAESAKKELEKGRYVIFEGFDPSVI